MLSCFSPVSLSFQAFSPQLSMLAQPVKTLLIKQRASQQDAEGENLLMNASAQQPTPRRLFIYSINLTCNTAFSQGLHLSFLSPSSLPALTCSNSLPSLSVSLSRPCPSVQILAGRQRERRGAALPAGWSHGSSPPAAPRRGGGRRGGAGRTRCLALLFPLPPSPPGTPLSRLRSSQRPAVPPAGP